MAIVGRIRRSRLRQVMRGYRKLRGSGRLDRIATVKQTLTERPLNMINGQLSSAVMGCGAAAGELVIRQYLLVRVGGINLNRALLLASRKINARVVFPLPREWREIVAQQGFEIASFRSALLWQLYVVALLLHGIVKIGKIALAGMRASNYSQRNPKSHVYFADLGSGNLPHEAHGKQSYDVISWYLQWQGRRLDIQAIHHSAANSVCKVVGDTEIVPQRGPLPALAGLEEIAKYIFWAMPAIFTAAVDIIRGRWWHALLLNQAALAAQARIVPSNSLAKEYLFHNSGWIYRGLMKPSGAAP